MKDNKSKIEEAVEFFSHKFNVEYDGQTKEENFKDWKKCLEYVGKYGLYYEVFVFAHENLNEDSTFSQCSSAIGIQMAEWDL